MAGAEERGSEEVAEEPNEGADGENKPLVASEFAQTVVLFPDFLEKSESARLFAAHTFVPDRRIFHHNTLMHHYARSGSYS